MRLDRIHITGASGAGVSTLGAALARHRGVPLYDTDDFFWLPTTPPYRERRAVAERLELMEPLFAGPAWISSGSLDGWGDPLIPRFTQVVFLSAPTEVRLARLREREARVFGAAAIAPGGPSYEEHEAFITWASAYDAGTAEGRSLPRHNTWLAHLPCPVLRLDGTLPVGTLLAAVMALAP